eukprot:TRINITY_DN17729_c0_g1_i2.p1 TRINITY_DN17729_c0_g1~~TRINITY_DN17729_c0_g1_i2.p1  ORF type:complete len:109 (+),score=12.04 TRINITY_DN17729_c0_g1_i2:76-402(+)
MISEGCKSMNVFCILITFLQPKLSRSLPPFNFFFLNFAKKLLSLAPSEEITHFLKGTHFPPWSQTPLWISTALSLRSPPTLPKFSFAQTLIFAFKLFILDANLNPAHP